MEFFQNLDVWLENFLLSVGIWAPLLSSLFVFLEGIFAFLPLFVFITINFLTMGSLFGFIVSWICTCLGSMATFFIFRKGLSKWFHKFIKNKNSAKKFMEMVDHLKFSQLVLIISIPFTPSFFINLGAGLSNLNVNKYFSALLLGKMTIVAFWGFVGSSLVECLTNPLALIKVFVMVIMGYVVSLFINKKFNLDERL